MLLLTTVESGALHPLVSVLTPTLLRGVVEGSPLAVVIELCALSVTTTGVGGARAALNGPMFGFSNIPLPF